MPPHCDALDGPVVRAAREALDAADVSLVLPYVPEMGERELRALFDRTLEVRADGGVARELADRLFFETAVRLHRAGEGEPFEGLKPAGLDHGPVIPVAERAIESGRPEALSDLLSMAVAQEVRRRFAVMTRLAEEGDGSVSARRHYVSAMLDLQVWAHELFQATVGRAYEPHAHDGSSARPTAPRQAVA